MAITRIHVNQHVLRANIQRGRNGEELQPCITVKCGKSNTYGFEAEILGPSKVVYSPHKPLSCGARMWVETTAEVRVRCTDAEVVIEGETEANG